MGEVCNSRFLSLVDVERFGQKELQYALLTMNYGATIANRESRTLTTTTTRTWDSHYSASLSIHSSNRYCFTYRSKRERERKRKREMVVARAKSSHLELIELAASRGAGTSLVQTFYRSLTPRHHLKCDENLREVTPQSQRYTARSVAFDRFGIHPPVRPEYTLLSLRIQRQRSAISSSE